MTSTHEAARVWIAWPRATAFIVTGVDIGAAADVMTQPSELRGRAAASRPARPPARQAAQPEPAASARRCAGGPDGARGARAPADAPRLGREADVTCADR